MSTPYSIDFVAQLFRVTVLHPSIGLVVLPILYAFQVDTDSWIAYYSIRYLVALVIIYVVHATWLRIKRRKKLQWEEQIVVITGGASGIGQILAELLAIRQVTVVVLDRNPIETQQSNIIYHQCDVSDPKQVESAAKKIIKEVGHPTVLVNNAAVVDGKLLTELSVEEIQDVVGTNFTSNLWTIKQFLPNMIKNNRGHIITMSSALSLAGCPQAGVYSATKSAVYTLHEALRQEIVSRHCADKINVSLFCLGHVNTGLFNGVYFPWPFITPTLEPIHVVKVIIDVLDRDESQTIYMPLYVHLMPVMKMMPNWVNQIAYKVMGANNAMKTWKKPERSH
ncbi:uncharacterized protein VTP21DRAFT_3079 [Calcarisporiella thermophila]|uniref:uncharacterized protein n=1 Tax=Calcarisporiella thermophila TaxID=911321 RepID=UPI00374385A2